MNPDHDSTDRPSNNEGGPEEALEEKLRHILAANKPVVIPGPYRSERDRYVKRYLVLTLILFGVCIGLWDRSFYDASKGCPADLVRLLWTASWTFLGFVLIAHQARDHPSQDPYPSYVWYYPFLLAGISCFVFGICHAFTESKTYLFYLLSMGPCFILGYIIDKVPGILHSALNRVP